MKYTIFLHLLLGIFISGCIFTPPKKKEVSPTKVEAKSQESISPISKEKNLISFAKSQLGTPYRYGGADSKGFDCSGFVYFVHKEALGMKIPRTSIAQSKYGDEVKKRNLKEGDLVFFDTSSKGHVNHSGIYIGDGKFIHSSSGKRSGVVISSLDSGFYKKNYRCARRINKW